RLSRSSEVEALCGSVTQTRQVLEVSADFTLGDAQLVDLLKVQPEFRTRAEEVSQPQRRISGDRTLAVEDMCDPVGRHFQLPRQSRGTHPECLELLGKMLARVNCYTVRH